MRVIAVSLIDRVKMPPPALGWFRAPFSRKSLVNRLKRSVSRSSATVSYDTLSHKSGTYVRPSPSSSVNRTMYPPPGKRMGAIVRYLDNDGVSLALETRGAGPRRILFVHGWISSRRMFYDVCDHLDPSAYTMQLLDFRGAGLSDRPAGGYDLDGYASDLRAAIVGVDGPVEIVAHSMGARIAQYVALDPPKNLKRLTLVAPGTAKMTRLSESRRAMSEAAYGSRLGIERFQRAAMIRDIAPDSMERLIDDALITSREGWFEWLGPDRQHDFSDRLASITLPVLVVAGDRDPLVPAARLRRDVVAAINGSVLTSLRNVGHNIPVETPLELATIIDQFGASRALQAG